MTAAGPEDEAAREYGSQIITALEQAWAAIRDQHPEIPDVVIVTGAGSNQKGIPEGYRLQGHHWPERWITDPAEPRMPERRRAVPTGPGGSVVQPRDGPDDAPRTCRRSGQLPEGARDRGEHLRRRSPRTNRY